MSEDKETLMKHETFDRSRVYKEDVQHLVEELYEKCKEHDIPLLVNVVYAHEEHDDETCALHTHHAMFGTMAQMGEEMVAAHYLLSAHAPEQTRQMAVMLLLSAQPKGEG